MKKVLFVGEHPFATSGNSGMLHSVLSSIDTKKFSVSAYVFDSPYVDPLPLMFHTLPFSLLTMAQGTDIAGILLHLIEKSDIDALVMVGIDVWQFQEIAPRIAELRDKKGFSWVWLFPYDLQYVRKDWVKLINYLDYPCVYSEYGKNILKDHVPHIRYFRPPLQLADIWKPLKNKLEVRRRMFPGLADDDVLFGFVGMNQIRKDPQGLIKAFSIAKKQVPNIRLFMHTQFKTGVYHLAQYAKDEMLDSADILRKPNDNAKYKITDMPTLYNCFDCLVNCSMQEGLSWTPLEAMLCGVPVIASDTTSHPELLKDVGILVPCEIPSFVPVLCEFGESHVDAKRCDPELVAEAMVNFATNRKKWAGMSKRGAKKAKKWLAGVDSINELLGDATARKKQVTIELKKKDVEQIEAVLFLQHSSAGDVLMTTRCFKGLKERYGLPLHYMTSPQYEDVVTGNPHLDKIVPWSDDEAGRYKVVINPHGERIGPGHWGRNCNSILSDFYWKILDVEPDDFFIELKCPPSECAILKDDGRDDGIAFFELDEKDEIDKSWWVPKEQKIAIVHTTGGDPHFRTYKYMGDVVAGIRDRYFTIQLGGKDDYPAGADLDMRGKLSFRETAWVMDKADIAVTVDSFLSHLAGALGVSQVCLFGSGNYNVVKPNQVKGDLVCMVPDYVRDCRGLGPCSASVRDCPAPCTGKHDPKDILKAFNEIER